MSLMWENIPGSLPLNRTATVSAQKELFWAQCTHAQLNPFYHPFYPDVTQVREDTRTSPALPYWMQQKAGWGMGTRPCMSKLRYWTFYLYSTTQWGTVYQAAYRNFQPDKSRVKTEFRCYEAKIENTGSHPGYLWLEPPVVCHRATTAGKPPTLIILYMCCTGGTECLSRTPGRHSVCAIRTLLGVDRKILPIRKEPVQSGFLTPNAQSILPHTKFRCHL